MKKIFEIGYYAYHEACEENIKKSNSTVTNWCNKNANGISLQGDFQLKKC